MSTISLLNTGIIVLVSAIKNAFPTSQWAHAGTRGDILFCDFYLPQPVHEKISLEVVGQTLRSVMEQLESISMREMLLGNALAYLKHYKGEWPLLREEEDPQQLTYIAELNGKPFLANGPIILDLEELQDCRLWEVQLLPCEAIPSSNILPVRFTAYAVSDKSDLSHQRKKLQQIKRDNSVEKGTALQLFIPPQNEDQRWIWLPKGVSLRQRLLSRILSQFNADVVQGTSLNAQEEVEEVLQQNALCLLHYLEKKSSLPLTFFQSIEIHSSPAPFSSPLQLYDCPSSTRLTGHIFCSEEKLGEELISSLQIIEKTYKMFAIEGYWALRLSKPRKHQDKADWKKMQQCMQQAIDKCGYSCELLPSEDEQAGPQAEFVVNDSYGCPWNFARITACAGYPVLDDALQKRLQNGKPKVAILQVDALESLERLIAVLLEQHKDMIFELFSEQLKNQ
ncbi:MAG: hypothetical protein WC222_09720 [Parachlamydiales bacterium]|jgi:threonyl-tRNA synthetase